MKKVGISIAIIGLLFALLTTIDILMKERVTDPAKIEVAQLKVQHRIWQPMLGAILVMIGAGMYKVGKSTEGKMAV
jgi:hypothetical protein